MLDRKDRIKKAKKLHSEYLHLRASGQKKESLKIEREYLDIRKQLIDEVSTEIMSKKSVHISQIVERVSQRVKSPKRETGIPSLDRELVDEKGYVRGSIGGFTLGNFIQIAGTRGTGKTTILAKMMTSMSNYETVSWFNFEMSDEKAVEILGQFEYKDIEYYDGSRELSDMSDEIKFLYADGIRHFVIDSMMKISAKGYERGYSSFSHISSKLSELTSTLGINIYLINQMSQDSQKTGQLMMKHGNDAEYDADYLLYVTKASTGDTDEAGQEIVDESKRFIVCTKNRVDHRLFTVEIPKSEIFGIKPIEVIYEG